MILLLRLPNWLGDVVMALPALHALEQAGYQLHLIAKPWVRSLLCNTNWVCLDVTDKSLPQHLKQHMARDCLLLPNSFSSAWMAVRAGKSAYGYRDDWRRLLLKKSFKKIYHVHESVGFLYLAMAYIACQQGDHVSPHAVVKPTGVMLSNLYDQPRLSCLAKDYIVIVPFAIGTGYRKQSKVWPYWRDLVAKISQQTQVVCCPGPSQLEQEAAKQLGAVTVIGDANLAQYARILRHASAVLGNDSGPMHMAAALNNRALTVFGVSCPQRFAPIGGAYIGGMHGWPTAAEVLRAMG